MRLRVYYGIFQREGRSIPNLCTSKYLYLHKLGGEVDVVGAAPGEVLLDQLLHRVYRRLVRGDGQDGGDVGRVAGVEEQHDDVPGGHEGLEVAGGAGGRQLAGAPRQRPRGVQQVAAEAVCKQQYHEDSR